VTEDARFEDADEAPLRLRALDGDDLKVISALAQDAVLTGREMRWDRKARRLALLINRYRRERAGGQPERVQAMLVIENVMAVRSQGLRPGDADMVLSLLAIDFAPDAEPPGGRIELTFAGDGVVAADVEALEVIVKDVTRPYVAPSGKAPDHPE